MYSVKDTACAVGFPIRTFTDQSLFAAPRNLSQRTTSFVASDCQGIHHMLLRRLNSNHAQGQVRCHVFDTFSAFFQTFIFGCLQNLFTMCKNRSPESQAIKGQEKAPCLLITRPNDLQPVHPYRGGAEEDRTPDLLNANQALSQLSYGPIPDDRAMVGQGGLEPPTPRLSSVCSCLLYTSPSPRDGLLSRMPSSA